MNARRLENQARSGIAVRGWLWRSLWVTCMLAVVVPAFSKEGMDRNARIDIIRGLLREVAVTKVPLPRGKKGVRVDGQGKLDLADASEGNALQWRGDEIGHAGRDYQDRVQGEPGCFRGQRGREIRQEVVPTH